MEQHVAETFEKKNGIHANRCQGISKQTIFVCGNGISLGLLSGHEFLHLLKGFPISRFERANSLIMFKMLLITRIMKISHKKCSE